MKIFKGNILTCDSQNSVKKYLVEDKGKIVFTGDILPDTYKGFKISELNEKALIPSFGDTHTHFLSYSLFSATLDVRESENFEDLSRHINNYAKRCKNKVILGFGISPSSLKEEKLPDSDDLDGMYSLKPLMIVKYDGHAAVLNSRMLKLLPKKIQKLRGFNTNGYLLHEAFYAATDFVTSKVSIFSLLKNLQSCIDDMAEKGVSIIHTAESVGFPFDLDVDIVRMMIRAQKNPIQFRVFFQTMDLKKIFKRKLPRVGGCFKTALDGCFGSKDAALLNPYENSSSNGILFYTDEIVKQFVIEANRKGLQIQLHAIGDAAFKQAVHAFSAALKDYHRSDHRHSIIHGCLADRRSLEMCAELNICIAAQPAFLNWNLEPAHYLEKIIGKRTYDISPYRTILDMGIHVSGGSDAPCTTVDPINGMYCACNHYVKEESISIEEALKMFTYEAAYLGFDEKERGSLEVSKVADMVVLNKNPYELNREDLKELKVEEFYLSGSKYEKDVPLTSKLLSYLKGRGKKM